MQMMASQARVHDASEITGDYIYQREDEREC